jgi:hypothetical protein
MAPLSYPVILSVSAVSLVIIGAITWITSGSLIAAIVVFALAGVVIYVLLHFGTLQVQQTNTGVNIDVGPIPSANTNEKQQMMPIKEVFHVSDNNYSYNDAPAVCAAYGAELASYDQLIEAHSQGAEWCAYGWSAAGMALYPTQEKTWAALQQQPEEVRRTACGHPGVNGGYFDPKLKFGVNCYGKKPRNMGTKLPRPLPGTDETAFNKMVDRFKQMLSSMKLSPFNRVTWSNNIGGYYPSTSKAEPAPPTTPPNVAPAQVKPAEKQTGQAPPKNSTFMESYNQLVSDTCAQFGICSTESNKSGETPSASSYTNTVGNNAVVGATMAGVKQGP